MSSAPFNFAALPATFAELPPVEGMPQGCAWGLFDKDGVKDELGTLNYLTADNCRRVVAAECQTGERTQLDWSLDNMNFPGFGRKGLEHKLVDLKPLGFVATDDEVSFNTQAGSQWDSFRHVAHQSTGHYYNGLKHDELHSGTLRNGIHKWVQAGGIAGRGVLVDWLSWWEANHDGAAPAPNASTDVPLAEIKATLEAQGTELQPGDLLLIRTGFVRWHEAADDEAKRAHQKSSEAIGLEQSQEVLDWLWVNKFSAVACDTVAFENWPPRKSVMLHEWLLSLWGTPIGELWNLEGLSELCKKHKRYSFFLTSAPLHVPGGVGSPPNAIAVF